jgi:hypothetical protein
VFAHGHPNASELPNAFSLLATHDFTWLRVSNYQQRSNCRHANKLPASNDGKFYAQKNCIAEKFQRLANFSRRPSCCGIWQVVSFTNRLSNKSGFILVKNPHSLAPKSSHLTLDVPSYTPPKSLKKKRSKIML